MSLKDELGNFRPGNSVAPVEAFGRTVYVRRLTVGERGHYVAGTQEHTFAEDDTASLNIRLERTTSWLVTLALCDENGARIFGGDHRNPAAFAGAVAAVEALDYDECEKVHDAACRLNGMGKYSREALERAEKNSAKTPS